MSILNCATARPRHSLLAAVLTACAIIGLPAAGQANGVDKKAPGRFVEPSGDEVRPFEHSSVLRISDRDVFPQTRAVRIGRNKSMMVELPMELRDVVVSDPERVDAVVQTSRRVFLIAKSKTSGQANVFFFDSKGDQVLTLEVTIDRDSLPLEAFLNKHIPGSRIKIEALHETIVLTGTVRNPIDSSRAVDIAQRFAVMPEGSAEGNLKFEKKIVNLLRVDGEEQVMLKVTVAEMQRSLLKQMGFNLGAQIQAGNFSLGALTSNALPLTSAQGLGKLPLPGAQTDQPFGKGCNLVMDQLQDGTVGNAGPYGFWSGGNACAAAAMRMLERDGLIRTLAEPNLTAVSGETAKFLAGGEYPIPVVDAQGKTSVTYKEFGVGVAFTPMVFSEGRISLKIETEVSELTDAGAVTLSSISIPALKKRQAKSTVELPSGGSIALAGLMSEDVRQNIDGTPGLRNVPILGTLFRSRDFIRRETELVVIVTPYLVQPAALQKLARPDDGFAPASDLKGNLLGHLNRVYGRSPQTLPAGGLKGDYGFIVE